jgi:hypothetical protein
MGKLRKFGYTVKYARLKPATQSKYDQLAIFLMKNRLHPRLYLKVMAEFSKNFYPGSIASEAALERYRDYIKKIEARYSNVRTYSETNSSFILLQNDLYFASSVCDPLSSMAHFYSDNEQGIMNGYNLLKVRLDLICPGVNEKTVVILKDLVKSKSVHKSKYAELVIHATSSR